MKFYLVKQQFCDLEEALVSRTSKTVKLDLTGYPYHSEGEARLFAKFKIAFEREFPELEKKMVVEFTPSPVKVDVCQEESSDPGVWSVTLKSDVLKAVHDILHYGNPDMALQIELEIRGHSSGYGRSNGGHTWMSKVDGFELQKEANGGVSLNRYEKKQVAIEMRPTGGYTRRWYLSIQVLGGDFVCLAEGLPSCSELNRQLFNKKEFCDFEITSEDGTVIPCHKMFLCAKSPVFCKMLQNKKFKEARENKMTIDDMSTRGINALLQYLYCYDVRQALAYCDVALELLKAADKYDIQDLWKNVAKILAGQSHGWYSVDVALKLSSFAINCQRRECETLEKKMIKILAMKSEQLPNSTVYSELFPTPVSRKMFMLALEETKPGSK